MTVRVTVHDIETGEEQTRDVPAGDYLLICVEPCHLDNTQVYPTRGTHVVTIKGHAP